MHYTAHIAGRPDAKIAPLKRTVPYSISVSHEFLRAVVALTLWLASIREGKSPLATIAWETDIAVTIGLRASMHCRLAVSSQPGPSVRFHKASSFITNAKTNTFTEMSEMSPKEG